VSNTEPKFKPLRTDKSGRALDPTADQLGPEINIAPVPGAPGGMSDLGRETQMDKQVPVEEEPLIFRGLGRCDQCGEELPAGDQLAGFCRKCQVRERLRATTSRRVPRVPRSKPDLS
jgi:hypothetical protein